MNVVLKYKPSTEGFQRLYLIVTVNGKRYQESLQMKIADNPQTPQERRIKKEQEELAKAICAKRLLELQSNAFQFTPQSKKKGDFFQYFRQVTEEKRSSKGNYDNWDSCYKHLLKFTQKTSITFADVDEHFVSRFKDYLIKTVSTNSASSYFNKFKASLRVAFENKLINENPAIRIRGIKQADSNREFLIKEEIQLLLNTDCEFPVLKKAFIFSCFTGLRWSDCMELKWSDIKAYKEGKWQLDFKQVKTNGQIYLPISQQTMEMLGKPEGANVKIFKGLKYSAWTNLKLSQWIMKAGITKQITFHCARHTYATLLLANKTSIYTVMNMLGHKNVKTTQVYAKVMDIQKEEAMDNFPEFIL